MKWTYAPWLVRPTSADEPIPAGSRRSAADLSAGAALPASHPLRPLLALLRSRLVRSSQVGPAQT